MNTEENKLQEKLDRENFMHNCTILSDIGGRIAYVSAQTASLNCLVIGMQAENKNRELRGEELAYGINDFMKLEKDFSERIESALNLK